jgi:hypothetical protein
MEARVALLLAFALAACSATPPARWVQGGARVDIPHARWVRGDVVVEILPDGKVVIDGDHELSVDTAGRVVDADAEPVALLEPNGRVVGPDDKDLGQVGAMHASLPENETAWLSVMPSGEVVVYDEEGERHLFGVWVGCNRSPSAHQVCTLVSHLVGVRLRAYSRQSGVSFGVGVGVGVPIR